MGIKIIINGEEHVVGGADVSYERIMELSGKTGAPSMTQYWTNECSNGREGCILHAGQSVPLERGLIFNVVHTNNA